LKGSDKENKCRHTHAHTSESAATLATQKLALQELTLAAADNNLKTQSLV